MTRDELWDRFSIARERGWSVAKEDFPESVPEQFFPRQDLIFRALELISPGEVRFLILGQDPYFVSSRGQPAATGIAFAVGENYAPIPQSLRRIMKHVYINGNGRPSLVDWIEHSHVLLLNAALTVPKPTDRRKGRQQCAGRHVPLWDKVLKAIVMQLKRRDAGIEMIAWGCDARNLLCKALGEDWRDNACPVEWCYHPMASVAGEFSFAAFWERPVGRRLRLHA